MGYVEDLKNKIKSIQIRQSLHQLINLGMIVATTLVIWKGLMVVTGTESPVVVVLSGSMEPRFQRGDILFLYMSKDPIRSREIVVYSVDGRDIPIVHRVIEGGSFRSMSSKSKRRDYYDNLNTTYRKTSTLSVGAYTKLINSYMKDIDSTRNKDEPHIINQWNNFKAGKFAETNDDIDMDKSSVEDDGELSETEMLWREMEMVLLSTYLLDDDEGSDNTRPTNLLNFGQDCEHDYVMKEEIGMLCRLCVHVGTFNTLDMFEI